ncbi:polyphosphate kinase 1 [Peptococcus simiae]|uniref:polyphosphate kinase 1 n=1 Tax=Peptococcus simiae TaxID=1643805 RepID=UPI0039802BE4
MSSEIPTSLFVNRELSWLGFNERVLEAAEDDRLPLFERLRFISIYGSNLDEFFMVRVGGLTDALMLGVEEIDGKSGMSIEEQLAAVYQRVRELLPRVETCYRDIIAELAKYDIHEVDMANLTPYDEDYLTRFFDNNVAPFLSPQIIDSHHPFPYFSNKEQFVGIALDTNKKRPFDFGVIPVSYQNYRRYHIFENESKTGYKYVLMAPLIMHFTHKLFKRDKIKERFVFRITRNGDLKVEEALYDQDIDWRQQMEQLLNKRKRSQAVRLQLSQDISQDLQDYLMQKLDIEPRAVMIAEQVPASLSHVYDLTGELAEKYPALNYKPMPPIMPPGIKPGDSIIKKLDDQGDIFLAYPYHSMKSFLDLLDEAAVDPEVTSIKITLYRIASGSKVAQALIKAAENGKSVIVLVELKARFDEEHNIVWSKRLEEAGCSVLYGMENYKVHSKICLITRRTGRKVQHITQIGTGNYNEKTARQYTDFSLITQDQKIGEEVSRVFQTLQMGAFVDSSQHLLVAPLQMKSRFLDFIDEEIAAAEAGKPARIILKLNGLSHKDMIEALVRASQAGVDITLYVRGICCLRAGVEGYTENIKVKSMVGRFLEHPRIYIFGYGDREKIFIGSADWMTRNLLYRVEVAVQILDPNVRNIIMDILSILAEDNVLARVALPDGSYKRLYPGQNERPIDSQYEQYAYFKQRTNQYQPPTSKNTASGHQDTFLGRLLAWLKGDR